MNLIYGFDIFKFMTKITALIFFLEITNYSRNREFCY